MPTLTAYSYMAPSPRVDVQVEAAEIPAGSATVTLYQLSDSGQIPVRDYEQIPAVGGFLARDYEVPLGRPVRYQVEGFTSSGASSGLGTASSTQVNISSTLAVVSDPLAPANSVLVGLEAGFAAQLERTRDVQIVRAGDRTVALLGEIGLLEGFPLRFWTDNAADVAILDNILAEGDLLVRTMPNTPIPGLFYCVALPRRVPFDAQVGGGANVWDLTAQQVSRPEVGVLAAAITYARYKAMFATYGAAKSAYTTYLAAKLSPPPEV